MTVPVWLVRSREDTNYTYRLTPRSLDYLAQTLAVVTGKPWAEARAYIDEAQDDSELTSHVINLTMAGPYRAFADARCDFAKRLGWYAMVRLLKPEVVVETGVDKGLGSVLLCAALLRNGSGKYYGTDIERTAGLYLQGKYASVGKILYGDSIESLKKLIDPVDLFINDSDHSAEYEMDEYRTIAPKLSQSAVVIGDNAHVTTKLADWSIETGRKFLFWREEPLQHWYPGAGMGVSFVT